jgi:succinate dehydrogenase / fumarate reductase iron-sulfur subunit
MTVLDCLEKIRLEQDNTLMYRHSCHHSSCGTCTCKINGHERLTCTTKISDLNDRIITLIPLDGFQPIGDLVVDISSVYENLSEDWDCLRKSEKPKPTRMSQGIRLFKRFENCIECSACISACPVTHKNKGFVGPAVLAAVHKELKKSPQKTAELLSLAENERGVRLCERALNCSRVCPTGVYPARHIADLRRLLKKSKIYSSG